MNTRIALASRRRSRRRPARGTSIENLLTVRPVAAGETMNGPSAISRWLKFNFVGGIGIAVQLIALTIFRSAFKLHYLIATAFAVETAVIHNFLWHERFTWRDRPAKHAKQSWLRLAKFNASNGAVSIAGNLAIMRLLVGVFHMNYIAVNLIAVTLCSLLNFLLGDRFIFETETSPVT
jgi:putative flippase GtrA